MTFLYAYEQHGDLVLVPDDIWIMISLFASKYIESNAEALRHKFVRHEGKKDLVVFEETHSAEESSERMKEWDGFFESVIKLI